MRSFAEGTSQTIRQHAGQNPKDAVLQLQLGTDEAQQLKGFVGAGESWDTSTFGTQGECP